MNEKFDWTVYMFLVWYNDFFGDSEYAAQKYQCLAHILNIRTTAYMKKASVHTSTMPEASIGYF